MTVLSEHENDEHVFLRITLICLFTSYLHHITSQSLVSHLNDLYSDTEKKPSRRITLAFSLSSSNLKLDSWQWCYGNRTFRICCCEPGWFSSTRNLVGYGTWWKLFLESCSLHRGINKLKIFPTYILQNFVCRGKILYLGNRVLFWGHSFVIVEYVIK